MSEPFDTKKNKKDEELQRQTSTPQFTKPSHHHREEPAAATMQRASTPVRRPSLLQRMQAAPLDIFASDTANRSPHDLPPRSPTHTVRQHSGLTRRTITFPTPAQQAQAGATTAINVAVPEVPWHSLAVEEVFEKLGSRIAGLSDAEVTAGRAKHGVNAITNIPPPGFLIRLLKNLTSGFSLMLLGASVLCWIMFGINSQIFYDQQTLALAIILLLVVILTGLFQTFQEGKADETMEILLKMNAEFVYVVRNNGELSRVPAADLVPGDIVKVSLGEKVPADIRILDATDLKVNNAALTGENVDVRLGKEAKKPELYEALNIARSGCSFTSGNGLAIVFATGDNTFFGQIAHATTAAETPDTLLRREVRRLILVMSCIGFTMSAAFFASTMGRGQGWIMAVTTVIGVVVANVPEGLLPQMTAALTLTARRMLKKNVLVSNMEIIETLGAVNVICSDKTGTITCNRMTAAHCWYSGSIRAVLPPAEGGAGKHPMYAPGDQGFQCLHRNSVLNSDAVFTTFEADVKTRTVRGDASETALIKFFETQEPVDAFRARQPRLAAIPFNSTNKFMVSVNRLKDDGPLQPFEECVVLLKGAVERVIPKCNQYRGANDALLPMDEAGKKVVEGVNLSMAGEGERVLAMAEMRFVVPPNFEFFDEDDEPNFPMEGFTFVGYMSLIDPPRPAVKGALAQCAEASIRVIMVTGDHPATAAAICRNLGMITMPSVLIKERGELTSAEGHSVIVRGIQDIPLMSEADWEFALDAKEVVFARTMPQQKQLIVHHLHRRGMVVAMTGDGVNDAPALKAANVGVAMGSGSTVAKEAAQVVLLDDDFGSIVEGIREGRLLYENLKKSVAYVLSHLVPEVFPFLLLNAGNFPLCIETIVILCIDLGTEMAVSIMMIYELEEERIMKIPPRLPTAHLVTGKLMLLSYFFIGVVETFASYWAFMTVMVDRGFSTFGELFNTGATWRTDYSEQASEDQAIHQDLCRLNTVYKGDCEQGFVEWRGASLNQAQAAFFLSIVWCQLANILIRRTQTSSGVTWSRLKSNPYLLAGMAEALALACCLIYIPGLNGVLLMDSITARQFFTMTWIPPLMVATAELNKALIRRNPNGILAKIFLF